MRASVLLLLAAALLVSAVAAGGARNWNEDFDVHSEELSEPHSDDAIDEILSAFNEDVDESLAGTSEDPAAADQDVPDAIPSPIINVPGARCATTGAGFLCVANRCVGVMRQSPQEGGNLGCGLGNFCCRPYAVGEICQKWNGSCTASCTPGRVLMASDGSAVCGAGQVCCTSGGDVEAAAPAVDGATPTPAPAPAPIDNDSSSAAGPSSTAMLPGVVPYTSYNINSYGPTLKANKLSLQAAFVKNGVTGAEAVLFMAMAMLETRQMELSQRDKSKDSHTDGSANVSIFNLSVDMVNRLGYADAQNLNKPGYLADAVGVLKKGVDTWGARSLCAYVRGGYTGWQDGVSYGVPAYLRTISTIMGVLDRTPTLMSDSRRVDIKLGHV